jgi:uncharacterized membrane protein (DUF485 family)
MNLEDLKKQRDQHVNKIFYLGLKIAIIFLVPALIAVYGGKMLDAHFQTGKSIATGSLVFAFVLSWFIVIRMYSKLSAKLEKLNQEIKNEQINNIK